MTVPDNPEKSDVSPALRDKTFVVREPRDRRRPDLTGNAGDMGVASRAALVDARETVTAQREGAANMRERLVGLREDVLQTREDTARTREEDASLREQDIQTAASAHNASADQIERLRLANGQLVVATLEAHALAEQIQVAQNELDHLAHHDQVTGLPNRILLNDRIGQAVSRAEREGKKFAVMFLDLDQFKHINDSLGHADGDALLCSIAQRLIGSVRQSDTVSRQGGDEFVLLLPDIENAEDVAQSAQKICHAIEQPHPLGTYSLHISASIGISLYPDDGGSAESLIRNADTAMYHAKSAGRNTYRFFKAEMNARAVQRLSVEIGLRRALAENKLVLHYQPKINLDTKTIVGIEALLRWEHPERGLLAPAQFISIAEESGLILPIGRWVLREACKQARAWLDAGMPAVTMAVNTSALELHARDFVENLSSTLADTRLDPGHLELELTESVLMHDVESTNTVLHAITGMGIKLAVDDFGTGYSSLSYLRRFPISTLKIDRSFINHVTHNADDDAIVSAIISMGKSLKQHVIAEGVETAAQAAFLRTRDCDEAQGFYFGHPLTADAMTELLRTGVECPPAA